MSLCGNVASVGWELVFGLVLDERLEGTLTVYGPQGAVSLYFQGGLILLPLHGASAPAGKAADCQRANRTLCRALASPCASFEFEPDRVPPGLSARRSLVLRPERLRLALRALRARARPTPRGLAAFPFKGGLAALGLPALLRGLTRQRRSGTLLVSSAQGSLTLYLQAGRVFGLERTALPTWLVDVEAERARLGRRVHTACHWSGARFTFLPDQLPDAARPAALGVVQVDLPQLRLTSSGRLRAIGRRQAPAEPGGRLAGAHRASAPLAC